MITLANGAKVHAIYIVPGGEGYKPHGFVLSETETDWVTWEIYWDGAWSNDEDFSEIWEAESGHYYQKSMANSPEKFGNPKLLAEFDFGLRLGRLITDQMHKAIN